MAMQLRPNELVIFLLHVFNDSFFLGADLDVQYLEAQSMDACIDMEHD